MKKPTSPLPATECSKDQRPESGRWKAPVALLPSMAFGMGAATAGQTGVATAHAWNLLAMVVILVVGVVVAALRAMRGRGRLQGMFADEAWRMGVVTGALLAAAPVVGGKSPAQIAFEILKNAF